ncbi:MAG: glycerol-3-phosphate 1-O-acyltransferase PlsY [Cytophagaceae bacterium]
MNFIYLLAGAVLGYLIGSVPTAVWYGSLLHDTDVRDHGSGNAGATNTFRVLGKKAASIVMLIDIFKGWLAASVVYPFIHYGFITADHIILYQLIFGLSAVTGHIFPLYANFKGGKGVATLFGMALSIHLSAALVCALVFFIVFIISKYVSLGSMIASLAFPLILLLPFFAPRSDKSVLVAFGFAIFAVVVITHQKNIVRLINGEENKIRLRKRE